MDRSGLRARCKHGRLRLGKGRGKARPRTAPSGASQGITGTDLNTTVVKKHRRYRLAQGRLAQCKELHQGSQEALQVAVGLQSRVPEACRGLLDWPSVVRRHIQEQYLPHSRDQILLPT
ncbi:hypothetical protein NDU88_001459 [Pleurodeles waltl]|uniref:Uncharacterized protein n=1 Tax=Pleurodeles waltl TaxID=8319 RepID=A0AAV7Q9W6_PLEWA|nr:hypothetical protein NDU88_001459 [Pleurodeles waltl]